MKPPNFSLVKGAFFKIRVKNKVPMLVFIPRIVIGFYRAVDDRAHVGEGPPLHRANEFREIIGANTRGQKVSKRPASTCTNRVFLPPIGLDFSIDPTNIALLNHTIPSALQE